MDTIVGRRMLRHQTERRKRPRTIPRKARSEPEYLRISKIYRFWCDMDHAKQWMV